MIKFILTILFSFVYSQIEIKEFNYENFNNIYNTKHWQLILFWSSSHLGSRAQSKTYLEFFDFLEQERKQLGDIFEDTIEYGTLDIDKYPELSKNFVLSDENSKLYLFLSNNKEIFFEVKQKESHEIHDFVFQILQNFDLYNNLYDDLDKEIKNLQNLQIEENDHIIQQEIKFNLDYMMFLIGLAIGFIVSHSKKQLNKIKDKI